MSLSAELRAAALAGLLAAACAGSARAQGVVLGPDGQPLPVVRVRALLIFQERSWIGYSGDRPNRQDLLVELELAAPAPAGARWLLACPGEGAAACGAPRAVLEEVSACWAARGGYRRAPWPEEPEARTELSPAAAAELPPELRDLVPEGWKVFSTPLPEGALRLGPAQLTCQPLVAVYPGALGAQGAGPARDDGGPAWCLASTELMVLHSHFINVSDNSKGLEPLVGLRKLYQDEGVLADGKPLWVVPPARPGEAAPAGRPGAPGMAGFAALVGTLGAEDSLWLTVVEGRPRSARRAALDLQVLSHYPSAVEPLGAGRSFLALGATVLGFLILATVLLRKRRFAP